MDAAAAATPDRGRLPSILLARKPRYTAITNSTTAAAKSKDGYTMVVSFWIAEPPQMSLFSIHSSKPHDLPQYAKDSCDFSASPHVVGADGPFVLLCADFYRPSSREYFLYKAGAGDAPPSLERIPSPKELGDSGSMNLKPGTRCLRPKKELGDYDDLRGVSKFGILGLEGSNYLLAALHDAPSSSDDDDYQLRIYSSETKSWSSRTLHNPCPGVDRVIPDKVITLGQGGLLAWVDLSHGLLVCDVLLLQHPDPAGGAGGVSFFIPLPEPLPGNRYKLKYPIPYAQSAKGYSSHDEEESRSACWFRDLVCVNGVLRFVEIENQPAPRENKDNIIYDSDLITSLKRKAVDGIRDKQLSAFKDAWRAVTWSREVSSSWSNFWRQTSAAHVTDLKGQQLTLGDLYSAFPILSPEDGDDILYLKSLVETSHHDGWVASVDIGNKALKAIGQYYLPDGSYQYRCYDPQHPFHACTLSRHLDMTPGIEVSACRKITEASSSANQPINTSIHVGELSSAKACDPISKLERLSELAEKIKHERNAAESTTQTDHISQVPPVEDNLPQQQCFNKWDTPCYPPVNLLWPRQYNLAPQPCLNKFNGARYHGYSQQLSSPNSFAYGAHTGYGNHQQQWQQLPPALEPPIGVSWQDPPPGPGTTSNNTP